MHERHRHRALADAALARAESERKVPVDTGEAPETGSRRQENAPVVLPKIYNGRNRTFFLFTREAVEFLFPYEHAPELVAEKLRARGVALFAGGFAPSVVATASEVVAAVVLGALAKTGVSNPQTTLTRGPVPAIH